MPLGIKEMGEIKEHPILTLCHNRQRDYTCFRDNRDGGSGGSDVVCCTGLMHICIKPVRHTASQNKRNI